MSTGKVIKKKTSIKACCFNNRKKKYVMKSIPLLEKIAQVKTSHEMKLLMTEVDDKFITFLRECVYNAMINTHSLFSNDQIAFIYDELRTNEKNVFHLYQFVFQNMGRKHKCLLSCKCYHLIVILIHMLLPIFKIITQ